jgi:UDP-N-acetylglucosamine--N-acetylmuramyl-(pentapeptide) pyrophosphoryl-undecaprenol N-acetylglucosamine transferase
MATIMFQAPNGIGLGHISRLSAIALAVRDKAPSVKLPFVLEGSVNLLLKAASLPCIQLPNIKEMHRDKGWEAWSEVEQRMIVLELAGSIISQIQPDVILFDSLPCDAVITAAIRRRTPLALCLRKIKDADSPDFFAWLERVQEYFNLIIIPHDAKEMKVPDHWLPKTHFVGQIVRPIEKTQLIKDSTSGRKTVVICGGGGGYPNTVDFYNSALSAFSRIHSQNPDLTGILVAGPLFRDWLKLKMVDGVRMIPFATDLTSMFASSDLVICQAGYNTVAEVSVLGVPTICVPAERYFDDQFERAERIAASAPNFYVCRASEIDKIANLINSCIQLPARVASNEVTESNGAKLAADLLLDLVHKSRPISDGQRSRYD